MTVSQNTPLVFVFSFEIIPRGGIYNLLGRLTSRSPQRRPHESRGRRGGCAMAAAGTGRPGAGSPSRSGCADLHQAHVSTTFVP